MAKPERDHGDVDACMQETHGGRMSEDVGRHPVSYTHLEQELADIHQAAAAAAAAPEAPSSDTTTS